LLVGLAPAFRPDASKWNILWQSRDHYHSLLKTKDYMKLDTDPIGCKCLSAAWETSPIFGIRRYVIQRDESKLIFPGKDSNGLDEAKCLFQYVLQPLIQRSDADALTREKQSPRGIGILRHKPRCNCKRQLSVINSHDPATMAGVTQAPTLLNG
jgi:hypothetical protein